MDTSLKEKIKDYLTKEFVLPLSARISAGYELCDFNIHPFNLIAVASGIFGSLTPENIAKTLIYPRALGTSITTKFGDKIQKMCVEVLGARASSTPGLDVEYEDKRPGEHKILACQLKAGPNTINSGDVAPMIEKMESAYRLLQQNRAGNSMPTFCVGVFYGVPSELSGHYRAIESSAVFGQMSVPIIIGQDFWHSLTGDIEFYADLIQIFVGIFEEEDYSKPFVDAVASFAKVIEKEFFTRGEFDPVKASARR